MGEGFGVGPGALGGPWGALGRGLGGGGEGLGPGIRDMDFRLDPGNGSDFLETDKMEHR